MYLVLPRTPSVVLQSLWLPVLRLPLESLTSALWNVSAPSYHLLYLISLLKRSSDSFCSVFRDWASRFFTVHLVTKEVCTSSFCLKFQVPTDEPSVCIVCNLWHSQMHMLIAVKASETHYFFQKYYVIRCFCWVWNSKLEFPHTAFPTEHVFRLFCGVQTSTLICPHHSVPNSSLRVTKAISVGGDGSSTEHSCVKY